MGTRKSKARTVKRSEPVPLRGGRPPAEKYNEIRTAVEHSKAGDQFEWRQGRDDADACRLRNQLYAHLRDQAKLPAGLYFSVRRTADHKVWVLIYKGAPARRPVFA